MAYSQRNGVLLYKPLKMSPRLPPQLPRHRKTFRKPAFPQNKNGHPNNQSQPWRGRQLDHQNRNKRQRIANTAPNKQDWQTSKSSDAKLMNTPKGFFQKKPVNGPRQLMPNQASGNVQRGQGPFKPMRQQLPYKQPFSGHGKPYNQRPPNNKPPHQLRSNLVSPVQQLPFQGSGQPAQPRFSGPVPPQQGVGQLPIQSRPGVAQQSIQSAPMVYTNLHTPPMGGSVQHPISNRHAPIQQFASPGPNPGQPTFVPGQPPPPPMPCPTPMPYGGIQPQQILGQPPGALPPGTPYPLAGQVQPFVQPLRTPTVPGASAAAKAKGMVKNSSTGLADPAQDYFNSLPRPSGIPRKRRKRKFSSEPSKE